MCVFGLWRHKHSETLSVIDASVFINASSSQRSHPSVYLFDDFCFEYLTLCLDDLILCLIVTRKSGNK